MNLSLFFIQFSYAQDTILVEVLNFKHPIRQIVKDMDGKIYIQTFVGVFVLNDKGFEKLSFRISKFDRIVIDKGNLTTFNTLESKNLNYKSFGTYHSWDNYLPKNGTNKFCQSVIDLNGIYWVANGSKFLYGLNIIKNFTKTLPNVSTRGILDFESNLVVASHFGIFLNGNKIVKEILSSSSNIIKHRDQIYFASSNAEIFALNTKSKKVSKVQYAKKEINTGEISSLYVNDKFLFLGAFNGLFSIDSNGNIKKEIKDIGVQNITYFQNKLNICTNEGIFHHVEGKFQRNESFKSDLVYNDIKEKNNKIFAASSSGLWILDAKHKKAINLLKNTPYEFLECYTVEMDDLDYLWVGTLNGLLRINYVNQNIEVYLDGIEFNKRSSYYNNGKLYFGSTSGLYSFTPADFISNERVQNAEIEMSYSYKTGLIIAIMIFMLGFLLMYLYFKSQINHIKSEQASSKSIPIQSIEINKFHPNIRENQIENSHIRVNKPMFTMDNIEAFILKNIETITAESLRESSGMSKYIFYKNFSQHYDISVKQLIENLRQDHQKWKKK